MKTLKIAEFGAPNTVLPVFWGSRRPRTAPALFPSQLHISTILPATTPIIGLVAIERLVLIYTEKHVRLPVNIAIRPVKALSSSVVRRSTPLPRGINDASIVGMGCKWASIDRRAALRLYTAPAKPIILPVLLPISSTIRPMTCSIAGMTTFTTSAVNQTEIYSAYALNSFLRNKVIDVYYLPPDYNLTFVYIFRSIWP